MISQHPERSGLNHQSRRVEVAMANVVRYGRFAGLVIGMALIMARPLARTLDVALAQTSATTAQSGIGNNGSADNGTVQPAQTTITQTTITQTTTATTTTDPTGPNCDKKKCPSPPCPGKCR